MNHINQNYIHYGDLRHLKKAQESCEKIINKFFKYLNNDDFVGADMARNIYTWDLLVVVDIGTIVVVRNGKRYLKKIYVTTLVYHLLNLTNGKFYHMIEQKKDSISLVKYSKNIGRYPEDSRYLKMKKNFKKSKKVGLVLVFILILRGNEKGKYEQNKT